MNAAAKNRRAVFLDRDGTIHRDVGFAFRLQDLEFLDGAIEGLARMAALGLRLFITTNQSGIARGYFSEAQMHAFNHELCQRLRRVGVVIEEVYYCPFHPTEGLGAYRRESSLRKPADGMIRRAAAEHGLDLPHSFAVGDKRSDILAGRRAGCRTILMRTGASGDDTDQPTAVPDHIADNLLDAAAYIERSVRATDASRPLAADATITQQRAAS